MSLTRSIPAAAVAASVFLVPALAAAQSASEQANALNDEGKRLFAEQRYAEAHAKFSDAARLSPEGRFFFNVCYSLNFLERYEEAIKACEQVEPAGADGSLIEKTQKALVSLRQKLAAQQAASAPPAGADPATPTGDGVPPTGGGAPPASPPPPADDPFVREGSAPPEDDYKWSAGVELGVASNAGMGEADGFAIYAPAGFNAHLYANFALVPSARLGFQGYFNFTSFGSSDENPVDEMLNIGDLGGALFLSRHITRNLYWSPLVGVHVSVQQPDTTTEGFVAVGGRAEIALTYVFGPASEHAITITPAINAYGPASGSVDGLEPIDFNLDQPSATVTVGVGYQFRFATPFGATPLITLE